MKRPLILTCVFTLLVVSSAAAQLFPCQFTVNSPNNLNAGASVVADINGDGQSDIVTSSPAGLTSLIATAAGAFQPLPSPGQSTETVPGGLVVADFNGDRKLDVARSSYENNNPSLARVVIGFGTGSGSFTGEIQLLAGNWAVEVEAGDIDGDGDVDIVCGTETIGIQVWKNNGNGTFGTRASYAAGSINRQMELKDVSGDGRPDVILNNETTNQLSVMVNSGSGTFPTRAVYPTGSYPTGIVVADLDADGDRDVAVGHRFTTEIRLFRNNGSGVLSSWQTIPNPVSGSIGVLLSGDYDGDGDVDITCVSGFEGTARWRHYLNSNGSFAAGQLEGSSATGVWAVAGALDADGRPDVLLAETYIGSASVMYRGLYTDCLSTVFVPSQFASIQAAIDATSIGAERIVQVAPGTYTQPFSLNGKNVVIRGAPDGSTILDGTGFTTSIAQCVDNEPSTAGLENLVFRNGTSGTPFPTAEKITVGGAVYAQPSSIFIRNCRFENCRADYGGAVYQKQGALRWENCVFINNTANVHGGAALIYNTTGSITGSSFTSNRSGVFGPGSGSAIMIVGSNGDGETVLMESCTVTNNYAGDSGSAIEVYEHAKFHPVVARIVNTLVSGNVSGDPILSGAAGLRVLGQQSSCVLSGTTSICSNAPFNVDGPFLLEVPASVCDCLADLNGDGVVSGGDLGLLLNAWGPTAPSGAGDVNHDGLVDGADLALMLNSWGFCP